MLKSKHTYEILDRNAALAALRLGGEVHAGKRALPPEIIKKRKEIAEAKRQALLFMERMRVVDWGLVEDAVELMMQLDTLYGSWAKSEAAPIG